jgi:hypothetical protein
MAILWIHSHEAGWHPNQLRPSQASNVVPYLFHQFAASGVAAAGRDPWAVLGGDSGALRVNGEPVALGIRVMTDRDALFAEDGSVSFFSDEEPAQVVAFPGLAGGKPGTCARCRNPIAVGDLAVKCPGCGAWTHQSEEFPCWSYEGAETCPLCDQPNIIGAYRWAPDHDGW